MGTGLAFKTIRSTLQCFHARPGLLTKIDGKKVESSKSVPGSWPVIERIEKDNGKPVVTHTQA